MIGPSAPIVVRVPEARVVLQRRIKKLFGFHSQRHGQSLNVLNRQVAQPALDRTDVRAIERREVREFFLRDFARAASTDCDGVVENPRDGRSLAVVGVATLLLLYCGLLKREPFEAGASLLNPLARV